MHMALDLSTELKAIAEIPALKKPSHRIIITTNFKDATNEQEAELKKAIFSDEKALII